MESRCLLHARRVICVAVALALVVPLDAAAQAHAPTDVGGGIDSSVAGPSSKASVSSTQSKSSKDANPTDLGAITVTANKRSERLQDVPMAVAVVSGENLRRDGAVSFADYATKVPGLNLISQSAGFTQLVLRGITSGSNQANASVSTYIDEAPYGSSTVYALGSVLTPDLDPADIERIEVLRGPQGTLYGANSLGGLLKFVTAPPDATQAFGRVSMGYTSVSGGDGGFSERAMFNLPLVADKLALRVNAYHRDDPGYIDNVNTGGSNVNEARISGGRAQLLWMPSDKVSVRFSSLAQNLSSDHLSFFGTPVDATTLQPLYGYQKEDSAAGTGLFKTRYRLHDLTVNADLGWATLVSSSSYGTLFNHRDVDYTVAYAPLLNPIFGLTNGGYALANQIDLGKFTQELRLQSAEDQTLAWRVGAFYTREHSTNVQVLDAFDASTAAPIALPELGTIDVGPGLFKEWAGYADVTWHATSKLSVLIGTRYTKDKTSYTQTGSGLLVGDTDFTTRSSDSSTTYLFNPSYKITDDLMTYVRVATGFRPGGANVGVPPGLGAPTTFAPDKLTSYELGVKSTLLDHRMTLDADVFYVDWDQVQITSTAGGFGFLSNGGKAKSRGVEVSWQYAPVTRLVLSANASYTDAKLTADTPPGVYGYKGDSLPWVPKWNASVGLDYNFPLSGGWSGFVGGSYRYVDSRTTDFLSVPGARPTVPSYYGIDLHLGAYVGNWTLQAYAKNLTNEHGITSLGSETLDPLGSPFAASYVPPRTVGVTVGLDF